MRVLLVEDDSTLADGISRILQSHGMEVDVTSYGGDVQHLLQSGGTAAIILDINLPDIDGFEVLRQLRSRGNMLPVLLLTARDGVLDRVKGLDLGADDYLIKPFATVELVARLKALLRRVAPQPDELRIGRLTMNSASKRASVDGNLVEFSVREWAVLEYLMQHTKRVVSKQQIIDAILPWGEEVTPNAVEVYVSRIRLKTVEAGIAIRTIRGFGYMLEEI